MRRVRNDWQRQLVQPSRDACLKLAQYAKGDGKDAFSPIPNALIIAPLALPHSAHKAVGFDDLVIGWSAEKRLPEKTVYEGKRVSGCETSLA
jgi:hypothetical protein